MDILNPLGFVLYGLLWPFLFRRPSLRSIILPLDFLSLTRMRKIILSVMNLQSLNKQHLPINRSLSNFWASNWCITVIWKVFFVKKVWLFSKDMFKNDEKEYIFCCSTVQFSFLRRLFPAGIYRRFFKVNAVVSTKDVFNFRSRLILNHTWPRKWKI